ncbi:MAG: hypothetical protein KAI89_03825 [Emcibacter sp.]|nr:hypothetical protein [Emcibacter sp.]
MKYMVTLCLIMAISACDLMPLKSPAQNTCKEIAISRLKHPKSYDFVSVTEKTDKGGQIEVYLNFDAWNDFKVPMLHSISCQFQNKDPLYLMAIKWNGRFIRIHELDDIREKFR